MRVCFLKISDPNSLTLTLIHTQPLRILQNYHLEFQLAYGSGKFCKAETDLRFSL